MSSIARRPSRADRATRGLAVTTVTALTGLGVYVSYRHMLTLAHRHGVHGLDAHAFPLFVDGLDLIAILVLLADRRNHRHSGPLPWTVLVLGAVVSLAANVAVAADNWIARAISGISAVALLAAAKLLAHLFDSSVAFEPVAGAAPIEQVDPQPSYDHENGEDEPRVVTVDPVGRQGRRWLSTDASRRVPTTPDAYARWRHVWHATKHLHAATEDAARTHRVSLRTLQFIRAAGHDGLLDTPPTAPGHRPSAGADPTLDRDASAPSEAHQPLPDRSQ
ncbi:DUF2637 domain-containing protein [Phytohabitans aurantiacus]|uniref:DUF2637 domain-containing protein n=1 Tax=Phytohabitans aurantiacus TaxID=3016789 RepID=A0ABQ5RA28_9ACTN|nr:DUF2637 domain-containing protein [Phytohabitans aurantiacus]GLI03007.1 hypothetical protein Pa4123_82850 [Phytohabitans aurantiacus]